MTIETFVASAGKQTITKDPHATLDYTVDFTDWLASPVDTISAQTATGTGVTVDGSTILAGKKVVVWVSGGVLGSTGSVRVHITTVGGRIDDRTMYFKIKDK